MAQAQPKEKAGGYLPARQKPERTNTRATNSKISA